MCCCPWGSQRVGHDLATEQQQQLHWVLSFLLSFIAKQDYTLRPPSLNLLASSQSAPTALVSPEHLLDDRGGRGMTSLSTGLMLQLERPEGGPSFQTEGTCCAPCKKHPFLGN